METAKSMEETALLEINKEQMLKIKRLLLENENRNDYCCLVSFLKNNYYKKKTLRSINLY